MTILGHNEEKSRGRMDRVDFLCSTMENYEKKRCDNLYTKEQRQWRKSQWFYSTETAEKPFGFNKYAEYALQDTKLPIIRCG